MEILLEFDWISVFALSSPLDMWISPLLLWADPQCGLWATATWFFSRYAGRIELQFLSLMHLLWRREGQLSISPDFFFLLSACVCSGMCLLYYRLYCNFYVGIFCSSFQMSTMDFFSKDLNCMSVPVSSENSELAPLPLALFRILLYPGHFPFWLVMHILGFSWILDFPGSKGSSLLAAHHALTKEARIYCSAAMATSVCPSSPENLLFQTSCVLLQLTSFLFLFLLPVFLLSPVLDFLLSLPWRGSAGTGPLLSLARLPGHTPTSGSCPTSRAQRGQELWAEDMVWSDLWFYG